MFHLLIRSQTDIGHLLKIVEWDWQWRRCGQRGVKDGRLEELKREITRPHNSRVQMFERWNIAVEKLIPKEMFITFMKMFWSVTHLVLFFFLLDTVYFNSKTVYFKSGDWGSKRYKRDGLDGKKYDKNYVKSSYNFCKMIFSTIIIITIF